VFYAGSILPNGYCRGDRVCRTGPSVPQLGLSPILALADVRSVDRGGQRGQKQDHNCKFPNRALTIIGAPWRSDMVRPSDLAVRVSDAQLRDTFRLPIDAARRKAREIIDQNPRDGLTPTVENWRQLPDGQIEFAIRYFSAD
jgi:hypothetical protein